MPTSGPCALTRAYGEMRATHQEREREIDMLRFQMTRDRRGAPGVRRGGAPAARARATAPRRQAAGADRRGAHPACRRGRGRGRSAGRRARGAAACRRGGRRWTTASPRFWGDSPASTPSSTISRRSFAATSTISMSTRPGEMRSRCATTRSRRCCASTASQPTTSLPSRRRLVSGCRRSPPPRSTKRGRRLPSGRPKRRPWPRLRRSAPSAAASLPVSPPRSSTNCVAWPCRTPLSRSSSPLAARGGRALGPRGADEVEFLFGANPACPFGRCARRLRAASSRGRCSPSAASSRSATTSRRSSSTRSIKASAASRRAPSASVWRSSPSVSRSCASRTFPQVAAVR